VKAGNRYCAITMHSINYKLEKDRLCIVVLVVHLVQYLLRCITHTTSNSASES